MVMAMVYDATFGKKIEHVTLVLAEVALGKWDIGSFPPSVRAVDAWEAFRLTENPCRCDTAE